MDKNFLFGVANGKSPLYICIMAKDNDNKIRMYLPPVQAEKIAKLAEDTGKTTRYIFLRWLDLGEKAFDEELRKEGKAADDNS